MCSWVLTGPGLNSLDGAVDRAEKGSGYQLLSLPQDPPASAGETGEEAIPGGYLGGQENLLKVSGFGLLPMLSFAWA